MICSQAIACLLSGLANYIKTVNRYSRREALVQSGWGTQVVSAIMAGDVRGYFMVLTIRKVFTVVACAIIAACVLFLTLEAKRTDDEDHST
jgi:hypothetical protein